MEIFIDPRFESAYRDRPITLVDAGARGGLKKNWTAARRHLRVLGFEPDPLEYKRLTQGPAPADEQRIYFDVALHNRTGPIALHVAKDRGLTSMFEPNRAFIDTFPDADRFDTVAVQEVPADSLDNLLSRRGIDDVDFVKADTQGSELFVLQGAERALRTQGVGVEVEVEFAPIYRGQPLFADVDGFMRGLGFLLFDLRPVYWKRAVGRDSGGPYGQIVWADALYLKSIPALREAVSTMEQEARRSKVLRAVSVALLYGYFDYALEIAAGFDGILSGEDRTVIEHRVRGAGGRRRGAYPGQRRLAGALRRLWHLSRVRNDGWSVSDSGLGNPQD